MDRIIDQYPTDQQEQIRSQLAVALVAVISQILVPTADGRGRVAAFEVMLSSSAIDPYLIVTSPSGHQLDNDDLDQYLDSE